MVRPVFEDIVLVVEYRYAFPGGKFLVFGRTLVKHAGGVPLRKERLQLVKFFLQEGLLFVQDLFQFSGVFLGVFAFPEKAGRDDPYEHKNKCSQKKD